MASRSILLCVFGYLMLVLAATASASKLLWPSYYDLVCPQALPTIKRVVEAAVRKDKRMGASLLRLHFHDCFVNGCDGSILLDPSPTIDSEKDALPNKNSVRGYEVIDQIKSEVDKACGGPIVSCADIVAVAARDSIVALGGPSWNVPLGRRDSIIANRTGAETDLPSPFLDLPGLLAGFKNKGLNAKDLVVLSGGHTLGFSKCSAFRNRIYNETNIEPNFAKERRLTCPPTGGDANLAPFDPTPARFDIDYFTSLVNKKGLLHSDQQLFNGGSTDNLVKGYSKNSQAFRDDFVQSMIKMGNLHPLTGFQGQVRFNCRKVNPASWQDQ